MTRTIRILRSRLSMTEERLSHAYSLRDSYRALAETNTNRLNEIAEVNRVIIDNAADGIGVLQNGRFVCVNRKFNEHFRATAPEGYLGHQLTDLPVPGGQMRCTQQCGGIESGQCLFNSPCTYEVDIDADSDWHALEVCATGVNHAKAPFYIFVVRDITERKLETEYRLKMAEWERERWLEEFSGFQAGQAEHSRTIIHNIGNALMGVRAKTFDLQRAADDLQKLASVLQSYKANDQPLPVPAAGRLCDVVTSALDAINTMVSTSAVELNNQIGHIEEIIRIEHTVAPHTVDLRRIELRKLFDDLRTLMGQSLTKNGVCLEVRAEDNVYCTVPYNLLVQALVNIVKNGIESIVEERMFAPDNPSTITIDARLDDRLVIALTDTGVGLIPEDAELVFRHGYTTKSTGTGIGLHSVAVNMQRLGGSVSIQSAGLHSGATLRIELPAVIPHSIEAKTDDT